MITFFVFGALIVATGFDHSVPPLVLFVALRAARSRGPLAVLLSFVRTGIPRPQKLFMAWFGPKGVASMLFALFVLKSQVGEGELIFDVAAITIIASIVAHGLTDTVGAHWMARRVGLDDIGLKSLQSRAPHETFCPLRVAVRDGAGANSTGTTTASITSTGSRSSGAASQRHGRAASTGVQFSMIVALGSILAAFGGALVAIQV